MALVIGNGPNRGTSAPPPKVAPKPAPEKERPAPAASPAPSSAPPSNPFTALYQSGAPSPAPSSSAPKPAGTKLSPMPEPAGTTSLGSTVLIDGRPFHIDPMKNKTEEQEREKPKVRREKEMTWDKYNSLEPQQKAAVDFNTMLIQAREKDLNTDYERTKAQRATYREAVDEMFGEDGGSPIFAPETMAVLQQIEWEPIKNEVGSDLDDFLGLKVAISGKDLKNLASDNVAAASQPDLLQGMAGNAQPAGLVRVQANLASGAAALHEQLAKGDQLLQDFQTSALVDRNDDLKWLGGEPNQVKLGLGYGAGPDDEYFKAAYEALSDRQYAGQEDALIGSVMLDLRDKGKVDEFMRYAEYRSSTARQYKLPLGGEKSTAYRTPEEFRKLLGLDKGD